MEKTMTANATCSKCAYWKSVSSEKGECRRNAPQSVVFAVDEDTRFETHFPETAAADWCGEFSAKA